MCQQSWPTSCSKKLKLRLIDINTQSPANTMDKLKQQLKVTLATVFSFYLKAHSFHWNVEGSDFFQLHLLFEKIYSDVYESIDDLAERIRTLGTYAPSGLSRMSELSTIPDVKTVLTSTEMVDVLLSDNAAVLKELNASFAQAQAQKKQGLMNFLADRIDAHEKWGWFLRSTNKQIGA
jgi:starvation-inducible DNA-binding protein